MIFPSLEAFEKRLELPTVLLIFYDYFLKPCVGETKCREKILSEGATEGRLAFEQVEAFVMLQLKNNYFAWLMEAKLEDTGKVIISDYDTGLASKNMNEVNEKIEGREIDLEDRNQDGEEQSDDDEEEPWPTTSDLFVEKDTDRHEELKKMKDALMKVVRSEARKNKDYKDMTKELEDYVKAVPTLKDEKERVAKKRKVMKSLRKYTEREEGERRFRGWSARARMQMAELVREMKADKAKYAKFNKAYREYYLVENANKDSEKLEEEGIVEYQDLWISDILDVGSVEQV